MKSFKQYISESVPIGSIDSEVSFIVNFLGRNSQIFDEANIVGSWAAQHPSRMPDRRGPETSDIDLILTAADTCRDEAWNSAVELEKEFKKKFKRPIHLNMLMK